MTSIEGTGFPLAYKVSDAFDSSSSAASNTVIVDTRVRSLEGMQKEALVISQPGGASWRLACDEGPYLNGKDMAPFPLGFFSAGMAFCFLSQFLQSAEAMGVAIDDVVLEQDNYYTMNGSFLRGDAEGGAKSAELKLRVESSSDPSRVTRVARLAEASSPVQSLMRTVLNNTFSLEASGRKLGLPSLAASPSPGDDPQASFETLAPGAPSFLPDIITRVEKSEIVHGVEGGAGSSLKAEQKRTLHMHCEARQLEGMLMEMVIHLLKPIGSTFRFVCDETEANGGGSQAPPPLAYASAGIGFCYMTQLGRYAAIAKHPLDAYRIAQRTEFSYSGDLADGTRKARIGPVDTQVFLDERYRDDNAAPDLVDVGQKTCFLHAAMRGEHPSVLTVELNGNEIVGR
jgi:uncharacterized OsmC-like protein